VLSGQKLVFAVGVGSTSLAWRMKVYFDDQQYASRAQLPSNITVIPEFPDSHAAMLITMVVSLLSLTKWSRISTRRNGSGSDVTAGGYLLKQVRVSILS
jgi:hypothetical protein